MGGDFSATGTGEGTQTLIGGRFSAIGGDTNYAGWFDKGDVVMDDDNQKFYQGEDFDVERYWDGTNAIINTTTGNLIILNSTGYGTIVYGDAVELSRVYDETKRGVKALDLINDPSDYLTEDGKINYSAHPAYIKFPVTDKDNCTKEIEYKLYCYEVDEIKTEGKKIGCLRNKIKNWEEYPEIISEETRDVYKTVCGTIEVEGLITNERTAILEGAVYDLKQENQMLKDDLCLKDNTYSWCE